MGALSDSETLTTLFTYFKTFYNFYKRFYYIPFLGYRISYKGFLPTFLTSKVRYARDKPCGYPGAGKVV